MRALEYKCSFASAAGVSHQTQNIPCQDRTCVLRGEAVLACALADGAGSRASSHIGAECVTQCVCEFLSKQFDALWTMPPDAISSLLVRECTAALEQMEPPIYELACTLLFFAGHQDGRFLSGHLGDGVQIYVPDEGAASVFSPPENGEYQNETFFITSDDAAAHLRLRQGVWHGAGSLLLMSDGMADSLYQHNSGIPARACVTLAEWLRDGDEAVISQALAENMERIFSRHTADDMSLVLLSWR